MSANDKSVDEPISDLRIIDEDTFEREHRLIQKRIRDMEKLERQEKKLTSSRAPIQRTDFGRGPASGTRIPRGEYLHPSATRLAQGRSPLETNKTQQKEKARQERRDAARDRIRQETGFDFKGAATQSLGLIRDPLGFIAKNLPAILKIAGPVAIAAFAFQIAEQVFDMFRTQFAAGGLFDVRKLVLDQVKQFSAIQTLADIKAGIVFFTSDAGQKLRQGAPQFSNTMQLRDNHRRYQLLHLGE